MFYNHDEDFRKFELMSRNIAQCAYLAKFFVKDAE